MEGFVDFDAALDATDHAWDFDAAELASPIPPAAEATDDAAWLFRQASQAEKTDLGTIDGRQGRVNVRERVRALSRDLAEFGADPARRAATLAEVNALRLACLCADAWRSPDYDWPLLSD